MSDTSNISNASLDEILKLVFGQDVVDNAYAGVAGRLTKAQAKQALTAYIQQECDRAATEAFDYALKILKDNPEHAEAWIWRQREQVKDLNQGREA